MRLASRFVHQLPITNYWFLASPIPAAQKAEDRDEHVEEVEIDVDRGWDVVIGTIHVPKAPRVEHEQSGKDQHDRPGQPEPDTGAAQHERVQQCGQDDDDQSYEEEGSPTAEVAL